MVGLMLLCLVCMPEGGIMVDKGLYRVFFIEEGIGVVRKCKGFGAEITSITFEGIYEGEIFRYKYTPEEEGYGEGRDH